MQKGFLIGMVLGVAASMMLEGTTKAKKSIEKGKKPLKKNLMIC
jgi:hypothetical protein